MCWEKLWKKKEVKSPRGIIDSRNIISTSVDNSVTIRGIPSYSCLTTVADTNSMLPFVDNGDIVILTNGFSHDELAIGDIVVYQISDGTIIHRIEDIQNSSVGRVYTCLGDNNAGINDPYQILDEHIIWLLVGVVYCRK